MKIYPTKLVNVWKDGEQNELAFTMLCEVHDEDMDLLAAIKAAAKEFMESSGNKAGLITDSKAMTIADFDLSVGNEICLKHGFKVIDRADAFVDIHQDVNLLE